MQSWRENLPSTRTFTRDPLITYDGAGWTTVVLKCQRHGILGELMKGVIAGSPPLHRSHLECWKENGERQGIQAANDCNIP